MKEIITLLKEIVITLNKGEKKATLSPAEAAAYMGVGHEKVRELIEKQDSDFPYFKSGTKTRIDKRLLELWIERVSKEHRTL